MKKRLQQWFCATLIALLTVLSISLASCNKTRLSEEKHSMKEYVDSADLFRVLQEFANPTFSSLDDALTYYQNEKQYRIQDSVFFSLPPDVITNVYSVLVRRGEKPTKLAIASEYLDNIRVYSNLPRKREISPTVDEFPDVPGTQVVDTIVDGKHIQVLQKQTTKVE